MGTVDFIRASENLEIGLRGWPIGFCQGYPFEVMRKGTIKFCLVPLRLVHARPHLSNPAVALTWVRKVLRGPRKYDLRSGGGGKMTRSV